MILYYVGMYAVFGPMRQKVHGDRPAIQSTVKQDVTYSRVWAAQMENMATPRSERM